MRLMLDTNRYDDLNRGDLPVVHRVESAAEVWLSFIVVGELRAGFLLGSQQRRNHELLAKFLSKPNIDILLPTAETAEFYAQTCGALRKQGTLIPTNDIWIAALALEHDLTLDTRDRHFRHVPGLKLVAAE